MSRRWLLPCALVWAGCYRPGLDESCTVRCTAERPCSGGLACIGGLCRDPLGQACPNPPIDALFDADLEPYQDAPADGSTAPDAQLFDAAAGCVGRDLVVYCPSVPPPPGFVTLGSMQIDTDNSTYCELFGDQTHCVILAPQIVVTGSVRAHGGRVLVLAATQTLMVEAGGEVDVSSRGSSFSGAASGSSACGALTPPGTTATNNGGGAGGTFGGRGGFGGASPGASGGQPAPNPSSVVTVPRGGCPGGDGGGPNGRPGGRGGGAVVLIAGTTLTVRGRVLALGAGGQGGLLAGGGGGGGSGGLIALDGATVVVSGALVAAGGGGGGGGSVTSSGVSGTEASASGGSGVGGLGGVPTSGNGGGGSGPNPLLNGFPGITVTGGGGGGGGGGAGAIRIRGTFVNETATIVPPRS